MSGSPNDGSPPLPPSPHDLLADAEDYIRRIFPRADGGSPHGELSRVDVHTAIAWHAGSERCTAGCQPFDAALAEVIRDDMPRLAMLALARLYRRAKAS